MVNTVISKTVKLANGQQVSVDLIVDQQLSSDSNLSWVFYLHGGGWMSDPGAVAYSQLINTMVATGKLVVYVHYGLAPQCQDQLDQCYSVFQAVRNYRFLDPNRFHLAGDSAGGQLTACLSYRLSVEGLKAQSQLLLFPVLDQQFDTKSYLDNRDSPVLSRCDMIRYWDACQPDPQLRKLPLKLDYSRLSDNRYPRTLIVSSSLDVLQTEALKFQTLLTSGENGFDCQLINFEGRCHVFFVFPDMTDHPDTQFLLEQVEQFMR